MSIRYLDSSWGEAEDALGSWLGEAFKSGVAEFRCQSGYFSVAAISEWKEALGKSAIIKLVLGSNSPEQPSTEDIEELIRILDPCPESSLTLVSCVGALFHPKVYHVVGTDGTTSAYIGSANFTERGLGLNIEAGVVVDEIDVVARIAESVDKWRDRSEEGVFNVTSETDLSQLVDAGVLVTGEEKLRRRHSQATGVAENRPRLRPAKLWTPSHRSKANKPTQSGSGGSTAAKKTTAVQIKGYPVDVGFVSSSPTGPSSGSAALSGSVLPHNAVGIMYALQQSIVTKTLGSSPGTADLNLPLDVLPLFYFGIFGVNQQPRAVFDLEARYLGHTGRELSGVERRKARTNVAYYGVGPLASKKGGHPDIRLLIPAKVKSLAGAAKQAGGALPQADDLLILEFPTQADPIFRLSLLDPGSQLHGSLVQLRDSQPNVGHGSAWWLPPGVSPSW